MARLGLPTPEAPPSRPCPNCGTTVDDLFCGHCGQRNATRLVSVRNMLMDALEDQLSVNSALPRTLAGLLFRPGFLTREYVEGRIVRYIAPFRLYLVTSVLFFLGLSLTPPAVGTGAPEEAQSEAAQEAGSPGMFRMTNNMGVDLAGSPDSLRTLITMEGFSPEIERRVEDFLIPRIQHWNSMQPREAIQTLWDGMLRNAPKAMFFLLPVFALLLKLLYVRSGRLYVEHFIFALHYHAFPFAMATLLLGIPDGIIETLVVLWLFVYLFLAMRRVYGQSKRRTFLKYSLLGLVYFFVLIFTGLATAGITALSV
jgi:hypothetical protein